MDRRFKRFARRHAGPVVLLCALLVYCEPETRATVLSSDPAFELRMGIMYFNGQPFTGTTRNADGVARTEVPYANGLIHGMIRVWNADGRLSSESPHVKGKREGLYRSWWPNGRMRIHSTYKDGGKHGEYWGWSQTGLLVEYGRYELGRELGFKKWRRSGRVYMNYSYTEERLEGLAGGRLCYKIEADENGNSPIEYKK